MKNEYEKYMKEIWDIKEEVYRDYKKGGYKNYSDFLRKELKHLKIHYREKSGVASND